MPNAQSLETPRTADGIPLAVRYDRATKWPRLAAATVAGVASWWFLSLAIYANLDMLDDAARWSLAVGAAPIVILVLLRFSYWDSYKDRRREVTANFQPQTQSTLGFVDRRKNVESGRTLERKFWRLLRDRYTGAALYALAAYSVMHTDYNIVDRKQFACALVALALASAQEMFYVALPFFFLYGGTALLERL